MTLDVLPPDFRKAARRILTPRQLQVLELMTLGHGDRSVARQLGISRSTARDHANAVLTKLRASQPDLHHQLEKRGGP